MAKMSLQEAFDEGFDAVKKYVDASFDSFTAQINGMDARLKALEGRAKAADALQSALGEE